MINVNVCTISGSAVEVAYLGAYAGGSVTYPHPAFDGLVDSNSILSGQSYTADTYFRFVTSFSNGTLDTAAGDAREWQDDIADYYTPDAGFTGDDTASIEFKYSDGATSDTVTVTITVSEPATAPTLDADLADQSATEGQSFSYNAGASFSGATSYSVSGLPASTGLNFNTSTGVLSGTPNANDLSASPFTVTVTATNSGGSVDDSFVVTVSEGGEVVNDWPFGKAIRYAAPKTWTWGKRHPKTGQRVRVYK